MKALLVIIIFLAALFAGCSAQETVQDGAQVQQPECPSGLVNDPYPGSCG